MKNNIKMTSKGQITLPKEIRNSLHLEKGNYFNVQVKDNCIILKPVIEKDNKQKLIEYARSISDKSIGLQKVREKTSNLSLYMTERVRKAREEEADESK